MQRVKFIGLNSDSELASIERKGGCLAIMGRYSSEIRGIKSLLGNVDVESPVMVEVSTLWDTPRPKGLSISTIKRCLSYIARISGARDVMVTPVDQFIKIRRASFWLQDVSYNKVMFSIFHMRTLINSHVRCTFIPSSPIRGYFNKPDSPLELMCKLLDSDVDIRIAYTLAVAPPFGSGGYFYNNGGGDAKLFRYDEISKSTWKDWVNGDYTPDFEDDTFEYLLDYENSYPENIVEQLSSSYTLNTSMQDVWRGVVDKLGWNNTGSITLFSSPSEIAALESKADTWERFVEVICDEFSWLTE